MKFVNTEGVNVIFDEGDGTYYDVGRLEYFKKKIHFEYDKAFLVKKLDISPFMLPLKQGLVTCNDNIFDGLFGVFADSLPDGWGRLLVDRHFKKLKIEPTSLTPLDRLLMVGRYGMGCLRYMPDNSISTKIHIDGYVILEDLAQNMNDVIEGGSDEVINKLIAANGSSAGARPKAVIQTNKAKSKIFYGAQEELLPGFEHWMVKFQNKKDDKYSGEIEYAYSLMAKAAGIDMPDTHLFTTKNKNYFAIKRFDREGNKRVHMHSLAGLVHSDFRLPSFDYEDIMKITYALTKDHSEVVKLYRLACFNMLVNNKDTHAKNFSYILQNNKWRLSPGYDITLSDGVVNEHTTTFLGQGKEITMKDALNLASKFNIKNALEILAEIQEALMKWPQYADAARLPKAEAKRIGNSFGFFKLS